MIKPTSFEPIINFSEWIRNTVAKKGITLKQLSDLSGVSYPSILRYTSERSDRYVEPSLFAVCCICTALGYDLGVKKK